MKTPVHAFDAAFESAFEIVEGGPVDGRFFGFPGGGGQRRGRPGHSGREENDHSGNALVNRSKRHADDRRFEGWNSSLEGIL